LHIGDVLRTRGKIKGLLAPRSHIPTDQYPQIQFNTTHHFSERIEYA
jgi:hypothetical protein